MIFAREKRVYQTQKARLRELRALAKRPCAALVFPRERSGCGNNEDLCAACNAREELAKLSSMVLDKAKAKLLAGCDSRVHLNARERLALKCH